MNNLLNKIKCIFLGHSDKILETIEYEDSLVYYTQCRRCKSKWIIKIWKDKSKVLMKELEN